MLIVGDPFEAAGDAAMESVVDPVTVTFREPLDDGCVLVASPA